MNKRIIFMGTGPFALTVLSGLYGAMEPSDTLIVYTKEAKPSGRGMKLQKGCVQEFAEKNGLPLYQPHTLRSDEAKEQFLALGADLVVVASYGLILPKYVLDAPDRGCVNVHASLLPRFRGAAPIQRAVLEGEPVTGVTLMQMDEGLDTGDILSTKETEIGPEETGGELFERLAALGRDLLLASLPALWEKRILPQKQNDALATYASKIEKADQALNFSESGKACVDRIRALNPRPSAFAVLARDGSLWKIHKATFVPGSFAGSCGEVIATKPRVLVKTRDGALALSEIQPEGKGKMTPEAAINGRKLALGDVFQ